MPITDRGPLPVRLRRVLTADPQAPALHFEGRVYPWRFLQRAVDELDGLLRRPARPMRTGSASCCATALGTSPRSSR